MIMKQCKNCGKDFKIFPYRKVSASFCSKFCFFKSKIGRALWNKGKKTGLVPRSAFKKGHIPWNKNIILKNCKICNKSFEITRSRAEKKGAKFCSMKCRNVSYLRTIQKKCEVCRKKFSTTPSETKRGGGRFCSRICLFSSPAWRENQSKKHLENPLRYWLGKKRPMISGHKHYNWRGGHDPVGRFSAAYYRWRAACLRRDNKLCRLANSNCNGRIEVHHILNWSEFPLLRFKKENGITLCHFHHPMKREDEKKLVPKFRKLLSNTYAYA